MNQEQALKNILGWAQGIEESSRDEASRKVAGWIVSTARDGLKTPPPEATAPKDRHPICATDGCELLIPDETVIWVKDATGHGHECTRDQLKAVRQPQKESR